MKIEIELKAWVPDPEELKKKISNMAIFRGTFEKNDIFFSKISVVQPDFLLKKTAGLGGNTGYGVRIRQETFTDIDGISKQVYLVTCKIKEVREGIEANDEKEFEVSSDSAFKEFLLQLGFEEKTRKRKKGSSYTYNNMTVELTEVEGLGWFVELEILLPERDEKQIKLEKEKLLCFLDGLGISRNSIESRGYTAMLAEKHLDISD